MFKKNKNKSKEIKINNLIKGIAPMAIFFESNEITVGDSYMRMISVVDLNQQLDAGWLRNAINLENITIITQSESIKTRKMIKELEKALKESRRRTEREGEDELVKQQALMDYQGLVDLYTKIAKEKQAVYATNIIIKIVAKTKKELAEKSEYIITFLETEGISARTNTLCQEEAFKSGFFNINEKITQFKREIPSESLAASFPFVCESISDENGIFIGQDANSGLTSLDIWARSASRTNSNITILGRSGRGKSTAAKKIGIQNWARGASVLIIDPQGEYTEIAKRINGEVLDLSKGKTKFNPLEIIGDLKEHVGFLTIFFKLYKNTMTDLQLAKIEDSIFELYKKFMKKNGEDYLNWDKKQFPIMEDLYKILIEKKEDDIAMLIKSAAIGVNSTIWNGTSTIETDSDFIVFDIEGLDKGSDAVRRTQYFNILNFCWNKVKENKKKGIRTVLKIDEAYLLIDKDAPEALKYLRNISKQIRKFDGSLILITQDPIDFLDDSVKKAGQPLLSNSDYKLLFGQDGKGVQSIEKIVDNLTEGEKTLLLTGEKGKALLIAGNKRIELKILLANYEMELFGDSGGK